MWVTNARYSIRFVRSSLQSRVISENSMCFRFHFWPHGANANKLHISRFSSSPAAYNVERGSKCLPMENKVWKKVKELGVGDIEKEDEVHDPKTRSPNIKTF